MLLDTWHELVACALRPAVLCRFVHGQWRSDCSWRGSGHFAAGGLPAGFWILHLAVPVPPQGASPQGGLHPA